MRKTVKRSDFTHCGLRITSPIFILIGVQTLMAHVLKIGPKQLRIQFVCITCIICRHFDASVGENGVKQLDSRSTMQSMQIQRKI